MANTSLAPPNVDDDCMEAQPGCEWHWVDVLGCGPVGECHAWFLLGGEEIETAYYLAKSCSSSASLLQTGLLAISQNNRTQAYLCGPTHRLYGLLIVA